jgi:fumarate reductase flavoprotein subunit
MSSKSNSGKQKHAASIVVLGGGGAGMAAAIAAREKGIKGVILLEKRKQLGGNSVYAEGIFAVESPTQKRLGIEALRDDMFKKAMEFTSWRVDPNIMRVYMDRSGDTIRWLEQMGLNVDRVRPMYPDQFPLVWHSSGQHLGSPLVETLARNCKERGVQVRCQTAAKKILTDKKGSITGVLAEGEDGECTFSTESVIIATGGFGGNKKLLKKYYPYYSDTIFHRGIPCNGDGIMMATELGAATEGLGTLILFGPYSPWSWPLTSVARRPETVWVNQKGERFFDEGEAFRFPQAGNAMDRQPGKVSYTLFDTRMKKNIVAEGLDFREALISRGQSWLDKLDNNLEKQIALGRVKKSGSWDEISQWIGAPADALGATVKEYNSFCDCGYDEKFVKARRYLVPLRTPPYYAIKCYRSFDNTVGGIKINPDMEAISRQDVPIPGLYAAGVDTGGWEADTYNYRISGTSIGFAIGSGRIAGENAAKYVLGK